MWVNCRCKWLLPLAMTRGEWNFDLFSWSQGWNVSKSKPLTICQCIELLRIPTIFQLFVVIWWLDKLILNADKETKCNLQECLTVNRITNLLEFWVTHFLVGWALNKWNFMQWDNLNIAFRIPKIHSVWKKVSFPTTVWQITWVFILGWFE